MDEVHPRVRPPNQQAAPARREPVRAPGIACGARCSGSACCCSSSRRSCGGSIHGRRRRRPPDGSPLSGPMPVVAAPVAEGRHRHHLQRAGHGDAARDRERADPDRRPAHGGRLQGRPGRQEGRVAGADRSASLSGGARSSCRPALARPGGARRGEDRSCALPKARGAEFDRPAAGGRPALCRPSGRGHGQARPGAGRQCASSTSSIAASSRRSSGRIGLRQIDPGNYVQVGSTTSLAVITQMQPITVVFILPEDELPAVLKRLQRRREAGGYGL